jgi:hypothetical protein
MTTLVLAAAGLQALVMTFDEGYFHRQRGLPRWERIGHPLDTATVVLCYAWLALTKPSASFALPVYVALSAFSCLFVTKDEVVHARLCTRAECWLHAILFVLHPVVLAAFAFAWLHGALWMIHAQLALTIALGVYQVTYWSFSRT